MKNVIARGRTHPTLRAPAFAKATAGRPLLLVRRSLGEGGRGVPRSGGVVRPKIMKAGPHERRYDAPHLPLEA
jgi:hypothetical protein